MLTGSLAISARRRGRSMLSSLNGSLDLKKPPRPNKCSFYPANALSSDVIIVPLFFVVINVSFESEHVTRFPSSLTRSLRTRHIAFTASVANPSYRRAHTSLACAHHNRCKSSPLTCSAASLSKRRSVFCLCCLPYSLEAHIQRRKQLAVRQLYITDIREHTERGSSTYKSRYIDQDQGIHDKKT